MALTHRDLVRYDPDAGWQFRHGDTWRTFNDPDGPATPRQLRALNDLGLLELRTAADAPLTKLNCAHAINNAAT